MKMSLRGWLLIGCVLALLAALAVSGSSLVNAADAGRNAGSRLSVKSLGNLIQAMGLKPELDQQRYDFNFKATYQGDEWELSMSAVLSQNGEWIWVMAWLDELPRSAADVPRTALLRLLAENDRMGNGKFFTYIPSNRRFVLQRVGANENVSTAKLRTVLQDLGASVVETHGYWAVDNWKRGSNQQSTVKDSGNRQKSAPARPATQTRRVPSRSASRRSANGR